MSAQQNTLRGGVVGQGEVGSKINFELLARVRDHILEEPRRYDQSTLMRDSAIAPCGTAACIAGWTVILSGGIKNPCNCKDPTCGFDQAAKDFLRISDNEASILFSWDANWPSPFGGAYLFAERRDDKAGMAQAAADYINWIIENGRVE